MQPPNPLSMSEEHSSKPRPRIQSLSDLIFGLALSIGALTLIGQQPANLNALLSALGLYAFSFLILISVWRSYTSITSVLPSETEALISINIVLLFLVSIEPYLFNELFAENGAIFQGVSIIYALDLGVMFLIIAYFNNTLADEEKNLVPKELLRKYKYNRNFALFMAALFFISTLPFFEGAYYFPLRVYIWIAALILGMASHLRK
jgi:uncharacterized membrane protein